MKPFTSKDGQFSTDSSIVLVQSTHPEEAGDNPIYVAVAVKATREEELIIFEAMAEAKRAVGGNPREELRFFYPDNKVRFDSHQPEFYHELVRRLRVAFPDFDDRVRASMYRVDKSGPISEQKARAILSALLVAGLRGDGSSLVIDSGGESTAVNVWNALQGLDLEVPMAHCVKADWYYPTALLAALLSHRLAKIAYEGDTPLDVPISDASSHGKWNTARIGYHEKTPYKPVDIETKCGRYPRDRIVGWFEGTLCLDSSESRVRETAERRAEVQSKVGDFYPEIADVLANLTATG